MNKNEPNQLAFGPRDVFFRSGIRACAHCLLILPHRHIQDDGKPKDE